ncbi:hypothetical protein F0562_007749 [Nyssa sinensis]|uniref:Hydroxyproline-rich glycoprotein family protein n=1 Tax=Nyssa sinensis TaxID=561372 RepID=A0A5J5AA29_9ASTE|nr:hypothetical protein F0562_007749 [Nyssa sinensis]
MRRSLGKFPNSALNNVTKQTLIPFSAFSTSAGGGGGGGGGRGRGRGSSSGSPKFQFTAPTAPGKTNSDDPHHGELPESPFSSSGRGHGRGKALPSTPVLPSFSSFVPIMDGAGRGRAATSPPQSESPPQQPEHSGPKKPIFFLKEDDSESVPKSPIHAPGRNPEESNLPTSILSALSGYGRGKPAKPATSEEKVKEENRHLRARQPGGVPGRGVDSGESSSSRRLSREDAVKKAVGILSRGGGDRAEEGVGGRGFRGRGGRGGGRGRGRGFRGRGGRGGGRVQDREDDYGGGLYLGDNADGERLAKQVGPENMNKLVEGFEEMSGTVLPSPLDDAYLDALHTNYMIECEPEYLMEEFGTNPDIDEKPPIPLRDALEKMKPFLMAYEGIKSQEEWEEVMKETMEKVPIMKELVDYYSGPDRVTAKRQQGELERVARTLPESAPASVKRFTERAVLSLQEAVVAMTSMRDDQDNNATEKKKRNMECSRRRPRTRIRLIFHQSIFLINFHQSCSLS